MWAAVMNFTSIYGHNQSKRSSWWLSGKELPAMQESQETQVQSLGQEDPLEWGIAAQPTPVFLLGESHEQRNLVSYIQRVTKSRTQLKQLSTHVSPSCDDFFRPRKSFSRSLQITFLVSVANEE